MYEKIVNFWCDIVLKKVEGLIDHSIKNNWLKVLYLLLLVLFVEIPYMVICIILILPALISRSIREKRNPFNIIKEAFIRAR